MRYTAVIMYNTRTGNLNMATTFSVLRKRENKHQSK
jgi:hypothetical protein